MELLKISVCITVFNETKETINKLLVALKLQTLKPDEIIIIDAKDYKNCSRSKGRNIAISKAKNKIIAITDAGCIPHRNWLERITKPFLHTDIDVVAGGYNMTVNQSLSLRGKNSFQKAESKFLGVNQKDMDDDFMPSARSIAFTKAIWKKVGGFPENLKNTAEDTMFNINLISAGAKFVIVPDAVVDWAMPDSVKDFYLKIFNYASGDAHSGIWWHPVKKLKTHNLKVMTIFLRYIVLILLFLSNKYLCLLYVLCYVLYAYRKAKTWGIILQFTSDFACIIGFSHGIFKSNFKRN